MTDDSDASPESLFMVTDLGVAANHFFLLNNLKEEKSGNRALQYS